MQSVRVPYDAVADLAVARDLGMPELDGYEAEIIRGVYRTTFYAGRAPRYHRKPA